MYMYICVRVYYFYMTAFPTRQKIELFLQKKGTQKETEEDGGRCEVRRAETVYPYLSI